DVAEILRQADWPGKIQDLKKAAATAPIEEYRVPTGTRMPFMSSRKNGRPIALIDVLWAGKEPISAYAFQFSSVGRRYRCITPKPCSNFYLVDLGPAVFALFLACTAPEQTLLGQKFDVCLTLTNRGTSTPEPAANVVLQIPAEATLMATSTPASNSDNRM